MSMTIYSCKDCGDRFPGCHSNCERYLADKAKHDEMKAKIEFEKKIDAGLYKQREAAIRKGAKWCNVRLVKGNKVG